MALQQRRDLTDFRRFPDILLVLRHFLQIFQHRFLDEQALGVLRKHGEAAPEQLLLLVFFHRLSQHLHLAPIGSANAADGFQCCGFSRAVAAHDGVKASLRHLDAGPPENVRAVLFIAEPQFFQRKSDFAVFFGLGLCRKLGDFRRVRENIAEPVSALPHGQGAPPPPPAAAVKHPHRRGHGGKHIVLFLPEPLTDVPWGVVGDHFSAVHHDGAVSVGENILHPMLRNEDGRSQFCVDLPQGVQKIRSRNGVKLAGGFVQDQNFRLHGHDGRQVQQLLLSAGQIGHVSVEPVLNAEIAGHFRHPGAHSLLVAAQAFQPEGQLMPDLVRHDLIVRILHDEAHLRGLIPLTHIFQRNAVDADVPASLSVGRKHRFQVPQQRCFAAAAFAAEYHILPPPDGQADVGQ